MLSKQQKLDADEQIFFNRQLEKVKSKTYDIRYPALKARVLFPVSFEAGPGVDTITYYQYDMVGMAKIIGWTNNGSDLPRVDIHGKEFRSIVMPLGDAYGYNIFDIRKAKKAGLPLDQRKANAAKRAILQLENRIAFDGDEDYNLQGFFSNPNIPSSSVPNDGAGGSTTFESKTADQIIRDLNACANAVYNNSNEVEMPNTLVMPPEQYTHISSLRVPDLSVTVKDFFLSSNDFIKTIIPCAQLRGKGAGDTDVMFAYDRDPDKVTLEIPTDFEQMPTEKRGLEYITDCIETIGGVIVYYPLSINISEGI